MNNDSKREDDGITESSSPPSKTNTTPSSSSKSKLKFKSKPSTAISHHLLANPSPPAKSDINIKNQLRREKIKNTYPNPRKSTARVVKPTKKFVFANEREDQKRREDFAKSMLESEYENAADDVDDYENADENDENANEDDENDDGGVDVDIDTSFVESCLSSGYSSIDSLDNIDGIEISASSALPSPTKTFSPEPASPVSPSLLSSSSSTSRPKPSVQHEVLDLSSSSSSESSTVNTNSAINSTVNRFTRGYKVGSGGVGKKGKETSNCANANTNAMYYRSLPPQLLQSNSNSNSSSISAAILQQQQQNGINDPKQQQQHLKRALSSFALMNGGSSALVGDGSSGYVQAMNNNTTTINNYNNSNPKGINYSTKSPESGGQIMMTTSMMQHIMLYGPPTPSINHISNNVSVLKERIEFSEDSKALLEEVRYGDEGSVCFADEEEEEMVRVMLMVDKARRKMNAGGENNNERRNSVPSSDDPETAGNHQQSLTSQNTQNSQENSDYGSESRARKHLRLFIRSHHSTKNSISRHNAHIAKGSRATSINNSIYGATDGSGVEGREGGGRKRKIVEKYRVHVNGLTPASYGAGNRNCNPNGYGLTASEREELKAQQENDAKKYSWIKCCNPTCGKWRALARGVNVDDVLEATGMRIENTVKTTLTKPPSSSSSSSKRPKSSSSANPSRSQLPSIGSYLLNSKGAGCKWYCVNNWWDEKMSSCMAMQESLPGCITDLSLESEKGGEGVVGSATNLPFFVRLD